MPDEQSSSGEGREVALGHEQATQEMQMATTPLTKGHAPVAHTSSPPPPPPPPIAGVENTARPLPAPPSDNHNES